ncbi:hypothetical protein [Larkinella soli]|uniref:hypothetical protein n=1 Tax=Larkinella soli TaxID=1770527 RepID=UPI000FFCB3D3|nr:hypothetical protein [Larkinella soli]
MFGRILHFLGKLYQIVFALVMIAVSAGAAWLIWYFYEDEKLQNRFIREGKMVQVKVSETTYEQHDWRDRIGNSHYIHFPYQGKTYTTRYVFDTAWVSVGDRVRLLYHPQLDQFRQIHVERPPSRVVSPLIEWSTTKGLSLEHKLLGGVILAVCFIFFFAGSLLVLLTGWTFITILARGLLVLVLGALAVFFTYDTIQYYNYWNRLRDNGRPMTVTVEGTDRHSLSRRSRTRSSSFRQYRYEASFRYRNQTRIIPIGEQDYDRLKPKDRLEVLYDPALDDFMPVGYAGDRFKVLLPLFFLALFLIFGWNLVFKKEAKGR